MQDFNVVVTAVVNKIPTNKFTISGISETLTPKLSNFLVRGIKSGVTQNFTSDSAYLETYYVGESIHVEVTSKDNLSSYKLSVKVGDAEEVLFEPTGVSAYIHVSTFD